LTKRLFSLAAAIAFGVIAPGRYGDMVAVKGDPLANVALLEHVDAVIKGGILVKGPGSGR
jgi:imidazolonepropionase-like amidohydrolase